MPPPAAREPVNPGSLIDHCGRVMLVISCKEKNGYQVYGYPVFVITAWDSEAGAMTEIESLSPELYLVSAPVKFL
jgi:hypothetical protein